MRTAFTSMRTAFTSMRTAFTSTSLSPGTRLLPIGGASIHPAGNPTDAPVVSVISR